MMARDDEYLFARKSPVNRIVTFCSITCYDEGHSVRANSFFTVRDVHVDEGEFTECPFFTEVIALIPAPAGSLLEYLQQIPDPRGRQGRRHDFAAMLATMVCAFLQGARGYSAIAQWIHSQEVRFWHELGYTRRPPRWNAFRKLLMRVARQQFEQRDSALDRTLPGRGRPTDRNCSRWPWTAKRCAAH